MRSKMWMSWELLKGNTITYMIYAYSVNSFFAAKNIWICKYVSIIQTKTLVIRVEMLLQMQYFVLMNNNSRIQTISIKLVVHIENQTIEKLIEIYLLLCSFLIKRIIHEMGILDVNPSSHSLLLLRIVSHKELNDPLTLISYTFFNLHRTIGWDLIDGKKQLCQSCKCTWEAFLLQTRRMCIFNVKRNVCALFATTIDFCLMISKYPSLDRHSNCSWIHKSCYLNLHHFFPQLCLFFMYEFHDRIRDVMKYWNILTA